MALVEYEVRGRIATITMNRPEKLNAMNREMLEGLWEAFTNLRDDPGGVARHCHRGRGGPSPWGTT